MFGYRKSLRGLVVGASLPPLPTRTFIYGRDTNTRVGACLIAMVRELGSQSLPKA